MRYGRALGGARKAESGESLVELMMTVAILGTAMVVILGAIWTTLRIADVNSKKSSADAVVRTFAETMKESTATDTFQYIPCAVPGGQVVYPAFEPVAPYLQYTATVTKVRYLDGYSANELVWVDSCPATDRGLQEISLRVTGPNNDPSVKATETVTLIKRDARCDVPKNGILPDECTGGA